ncbi:GNAT family N-acetyltransferase [Aeromicrobium wangtongii]|uniref:GNAT family N-acetyltransferase n=1 Tax=Aeromicrobium wangtongii TaxID=2969247 RepID=A0ABY5MC25_9ACTN|nr:GNAT family N-acetyltransferase [Aeromicrobium wangtongii]MCD9197146.1 GNAT family N-acetyltransferase [Aeromicrobium wangtongii]UUP14643.1 GNAT family N-acetyltransferase [Aeromicrobium wangtongii]
MSTPSADLPIDETSRARLAADGLRLRIVDGTDAAEYEGWFLAETRGFHNARPSAEVIAERQRNLGPDRRLVGVYDDTAGIPEQPVATTICWPADLTVPGLRAVPAWAVSGVTVAQTHRRRGIARALLEAELRTARALDLPVAMLTVSESTIYSRFGFSPAALARDVTVSTRRVRWTGPTAQGQVRLVTPEQLREDGLAIVERVRLARPGQISYSGHLWTRQLGLSAGDPSAPKLQTIRYDDADGTPQGFAVYEITEDPSDFADHRLAVKTLVAATTDAYAGLWRYLLEVDLVSTVTAHLRPVDEPLRWMIDDFRAVRVSEFDHLWVRVLDVPAALTARTYGAAGRLVIAINDPLGFAAGTWALDVGDTGEATVTATDDPADVSMSVNALGALYLGGVPASTLVAAGGLAGDAERLDRMFRAPVEPYLSIWF